MYGHFAYEVKEIMLIKKLGIKHDFTHFVH